MVTTTILVKAQVGSGDVDAGARTLIEMMKSSNLKDQLDAFPFNTIIKVCTGVASCVFARVCIVSLFEAWWSPPLQVAIVKPWRWPHACPFLLLLSRGHSVEWIS